LTLNPDLHAETNLRPRLDSVFTRLCELITKPANERFEISASYIDHELTGCLYYRRWTRLDLALSTSQALAGICTVGE
jgi:hypothetical protein